MVIKVPPDVMEVVVVLEEQVTVHRVSAEQLLVERSKTGRCGGHFILMGIRPSLPSAAEQMK